MFDLQINGLSHFRSLGLAYLRLRAERTHFETRLNQTADYVQAYAYRYPNYVMPEISLQQSHHWLLFGKR